MERTRSYFREKRKPASGSRPVGKRAIQKQIALLQEYYQKDAVRNKGKEAFEKLPKTKEFFVFFGAYKGEGEVIA